MTADSRRPRERPQQGRQNRFATPAARDAEMLLKAAAQARELDRQDVHYWRNASDEEKARVAIQLMDMAYSMALESGFPDGEEPAPRLPAELAPAER